VTGIFLVIVAAGLFSNAVQELREALLWDLAPIYNLTNVFPANETNTAGYLLRGLIGYSDAPTLLEVTAYVGYWIVVILAYFGIRTGKITLVTTPLRRAWNAIIGRKISPGADVD
jgi:high-affinity iron transporter